MIDFLPYLMGIIGAITGIWALVNQSRIGKADVASRYQKMVEDGIMQYDKMQAKFIALEETLAKEKIERVAEQALWRTERYDMMLQINRQQTMLDAFKSQIDNLNATIQKQNAELARAIKS